MTVRTTELFAAKLTHFSVPMGMLKGHFEDLDGEDMRLAWALVGAMTGRDLAVSPEGVYVTVYLEEINATSGRFLKGKKGQAVLDRVFLKSTLTSPDPAIDGIKPWKSLRIIPGVRKREIAAIAIWLSPEWLRIRDRMEVARASVPVGWFSHLGARMAVQLGVEGRIRSAAGMDHDSWTWKIRSQDRMQWAPLADQDMALSTFRHRYVKPAIKQLNAGVTTLSWAESADPRTGIVEVAYVKKTLDILSERSVRYQVKHERVERRARQMEIEQRVAQEKVAEAARREAADLKTQPRLPLD